MLIETLDPVTRRPSTIPKSDATNAYDLLSDVMQCIENEPGRLDMGHWLARGLRLEYLLENVGMAPTAGPACGTAACVAGWITLLTTPADRIDFTHETVYPRDGDETDDEEIHTISQHAAAILGVRTTGELFDADVIVTDSGEETDDYDDGEEGTRLVNYGDPEYVPLVIKRIQRFQAEYEAVLKMKRVRQV